MTRVSPIVPSGECKLAKTLSLFFYLIVSTEALPKAAPWLVIPNEVEGNKQYQSFYNICEPQNKTCRKFIPELSDKSFFQKPSYQGWLIIICDGKVISDGPTQNWNYGDCFLLNLASSDSIRLPNIDQILDDRREEDSEYYFVEDCILSSPPSITGAHSDDDDPMVYVLVKGARHSFVVFCRPGDSQWRTDVIPQDFVEEKFMHSLLCVRRRIYLMCRGQVQIEIVKHQVHDDDQDNVILEMRPLIVDGGLGFSHIGSTVITSHFLEAQGEIFRINMGRSKLVRDNVINSILFSRLDFSERSWKKVDNFDDKVLFVGSKTNFCCSAAELGLTKGCLYYLEANDQSLYKFEIEDNSTTTILPFFPCLKLPTTPWGFTLGWIMMPTSSIRNDSDGGRRMEDVLHNAGQGNGLRIHNESQELYGASEMDILSQDMVRLIASHMHPVDYVHFRAVSRAKRELLPVVNKASKITSTHLSPWLVFLTKNDTVLNFFDPIHNNENYLMNLAGMLAGSTICFHKDGWLLMSKGMLTYFFYNPFTKETIRLPDVPEPYNFSSISFTSSPTASDCVVLGITQAIELVFIRRGTTIWSTSPILEYNPRKYVPCFNVPVFYDGVFYCVDYNGTLGVFNLANESWHVFKSTRRFTKKNKRISFLVEIEGEILLVRFQIHGMHIGVFALDFSSMDWVKVKSLRNYTLFVSYTSCISMVAPNSRMENKIYFPRLHDGRILYYSLDTGSYHSVGSTHSAKDFYDTKCWGNCSWIEPNWSRSKLEELDWSSVNKRVS